MPATLRDIATELKVSPSLVSGVLNDRPNVWASVETRTRILETAKKLNYRPSAAAQALVSGKSRQIAVLTQEKDWHESVAGSYPDVRGLVEAAERHNYRVLVVPLHEGETGEGQLENLFQEKVCDGLCLVSNQLADAHLPILERLSVPCVVLGDFVNPDFEANAAAGVVRVDVDNYRYAADSVHWLCEQGHKKIAFLSMVGEHDGIPHVRALRDGYREAMRQVGLEPQLLPLSALHELPRLIRDGEVSAIIVRYLHGALQTMMTLQEAGVLLSKQTTIMALLEERDFATHLLIGRNKSIAFHIYRHRALGETAGDILIQWANGSAPDRSVVLVPPGPIGWREDILEGLKHADGK
jgi:DNA-binding LacI/PurR family transcriptional regulator